MSVIDGPGAGNSQLLRQREPRSIRAEGDALDTPRTFIGENVGYYDERWRWMDWSGRNITWNKRAFLCFPVWFAYRKMWTYALIGFLWTIGAIAFGIYASDLLVGVALHLFGALIAGLYANKLYHLHFISVGRRVFNRVAETHARELALGNAGGVSPLSATLTTILLVSLIGVMGVHGWTHGYLPPAYLKPAAQGPMATPSPPPAPPAAETAAPERAAPRQNSDKHEPGAFIRQFKRATGQED